MIRNRYTFNASPRYDTSNVTGRHRGQKRKLWAGYTAPSLQRRAMCRQS